MLKKTFFPRVFVLLCGLILAACAATDTPVQEPPEQQTTVVPTDTALPPTVPPDPTDTAEPPYLWTDVTEQTIGETGEWSNKVELADINGDGLVDLLFADGGDYDSPGSPVVSQVFLNRGPDQMFEEVGEQVFGSDPMLARVIKVRDINDDTLPDIMVGAPYENQSRLYMGEGDGRFTEVTATHLPQIDASVGDLEFGDVDDDGDLDVVLADWGPGNPIESKGGRTMLWLNDGEAHFTDVTQQQMPESLVRFSWELELVDVDNDHDLDIAISCKRCITGSLLYENDGGGVFADVTENRLPQQRSNYEFEAMDLNGDGFLDLVSVNDGPGKTEGLYMNDGQGGFLLDENTLWTEEHNWPQSDDNMVAFFDFESDGDADLLIGSLNRSDRLLLNDGEGRLTLLDVPQLYPIRTGGTLGIALADLNGDHRLDIVESQGEKAATEKIFFAQATAPDTAAPLITQIRLEERNGVAIIRARIHDNKSPTMPHDWQSVIVRWDGGETPLQWYGEYLWRATLENASGDLTYEVCATDAAGNEACVPGT